MRIVRKVNSYDELKDFVVDWVYYQNEESMLGVLGIKVTTVCWGDAKNNKQKVLLVPAGNDTMPVWDFHNWDIIGGPIFTFTECCVTSIEIIK